MAGSQTFIALKLPMSTFVHLLTNCFSPHQPQAGNIIVPPNAIAPVFTAHLAMGSSLLVAMNESVHINRTSMRPGELCETRVAEMGHQTFLYININLNTNINL